MTLLLVVAALFVGVQLVTLLVNLWTFPVLDAFVGEGVPSTERKVPGEKRKEKSEGSFSSAQNEVPPGGDADRARKTGNRVSLLVPARNEALNLPETLPRVLAQPGAYEVIVLNDQSTDATREVLAGFAANSPHLRVLEGESLPSGWSGKNWACHQLAQAATGDVLVYTDADVFWEADTLDALLSFKAAEDAGYVSVWPRQITKTLAERLTVPVIDLVLLGALPYLGVRWLPFAAFSAGNGQLMLFARAAYGSIGGHAAFRDEVLEDVRMGQAAKGAGVKTALALGGRAVATRMYRSQEELLDGFSKNILAATSNSKVALVGLSLLSTLVYSLAWPLGFVNPWWFAVGAAGLVQRGLTTYKTRRNPLEALLQPFMAYSLLQVTYRALRRGGGYVWKGREYGPGRA